MRTTKFMMVAMLMLAAVFTAKADNDKPIRFDQLPKISQEFIQTYFNEKDLSFAKEENDLFSKSYEVILVNGTKVEFDSSGNWEQVDCKKEAVPAGIIPQGIRDFVGNRFPDAKIVEIERERRHYEIQLNNGIEIKFDLQFNVIDFDD